MNLKDLTNWTVVNHQAYPSHEFYELRAGDGGQHLLYVSVFGGTTFVCHAPNWFYKTVTADSLAAAIAQLEFPDEPTK